MGAGTTIELQATNDINVINNFAIATATGVANVSLVLRAGNAINIGVTAAATITASGTGTITLSADDNTPDGTGNVNIGGAAIVGGLVTAGQAISITAANVVITATGSINAGAGNVTLKPSTATPTANVGTVTTGFSVVNSEIALITSTGTITIGHSALANALVV